MFVHKSHYVRPTIYCFYDSGKWRQISEKKFDELIRKGAQLANCNFAKIEKSALKNGM